MPGSVFFHLRPPIAVLTGPNKDVITAFLGVKEIPFGVMRCLQEHHRLHSRDHYYEVRENIGANSLADRAARIIYLNRTCFNGIYRVNQKGKFNVPIGTRRNVVLDTDNFPLVSKLLADVRLQVSDFEPIVDEAQEGDFVFLDPPYTVRHNRNGFVKYTSTLFSWEDQERLAEVASRAAKRGAQILSTNASNSTIRSLYSRNFSDLK